MTSGFKSLIQTNKVASAKSFKDTLLTYLYYWPLFLISLLLFLAAGFAYIRYSIPLYVANTIINVKGDVGTGKGGSNQGDLINNAMNGGKATINLDNELGRLRSARLMAEVVRNSDLNISYYREGTFTKLDIYHAAPFRLIQKEIQDSSAQIRMAITKPSGNQFTLTYGNEQSPTSKTVAWNQPFIINGNTYLLTPQVGAWNPSDKYVVEWNPMIATVYELIPKVSVNIIGKTSNIAVGITIENPQRGEDVLNKMVAAFIQMNLDDQNKAAQDKIFFIEDRLGKISDELRGVEKNLASYQGSQLLVGGDNASVKGETVSQSDNAIAQISTQKSILSIIKSTLAGNGDTNKTLPAGGVTDAGLGGLISAYNTLVQKREREASMLAPGSLALKDMNDQVVSLRGNILENLNSNLKAYDIQSSSHARQGSVFRSSLSAVPEKQRVMGEISREKSIKETLYMYLLQKREETALSKTTTTPYEQIDLATSYGPVSPDRKGAYVYAAIIGLILPVGLIFLKGMLNDKVSSREELENAVPVQLVGEVNNIKKTEDKILPSLSGGIIGEQFRIMRANFNFLQKAEKTPVILVTSSASGEGKSFISFNLAAMLAKTGKKVALLEFDLRKPAESPLASFHGRGLKDYLLGEATIDDITNPADELPTLHIFPTGTIISEAGDLIVGDRVEKLFADLKDRYDAIVINTPPVGLVADALVLQKYSTIIGYVIREGYTKKKQLAFLNSMIETGKFSNTTIIYNGVKTGMKYGYYGYGYTEKNSYFDREGKNKFLNGIMKKKKNTTA